MKAPKKFSLFIFFSLFLATILSVISCRFDLLNAESEKELEEALSNEVHFYSCEEGGAAAPVVITKRFPIGIRHNSSDFLSGSELSRLSGGGVFLGYKFYRMTESGSTVRPSYVHVNSDEYITTSFVSVDEMDILTDWGVNYRVNHFLQNTDGTTYPSTPSRSYTLTARTGENTNATPLSGSDIAGFTFDSSASDSLVQSVAADGSTVINLYYTRNTITFTFNLNGGNLGGSTSNINVSGLYESEVTPVYNTRIPSNPEQTGKIFGGWKDNSDNYIDIPETFPANDKTYYAGWTSAIYNLAFNLTASLSPVTPTVTGTAPSSISCVYEREYTLPAGNTFGLTSSAGTPYEFASWNTSADGTGGSYSDASVVKELTPVNGATVTLYAQWNIPYTVKHMFQNLDGTYTENTSFRETKYAAKNAETLAQAKSGTDITGYSALAITQQNVSTDGSTVIEVKYNRNTVTLTFELEGGNVSGSTADVTISGTYGQTIDTSSIPAPVYAGKALSGWNPTVPATFPAENSIFKAVWDSSKYNVVFDSNGGTGSMSSLTNCLYESEFDLPENTFTRISASSYGSRNYKFDHWNTASDNSGTTYSAGQSVSMLTPEDGGTVTLYAIWRVPYRVQHYHQNADSPSSYSLVNSGTQILYGFAGDTTAAVAKTYTGFVTPDTVAQTTIAEDGSTEVRINYNRQTFTVTYEDGVDDEEITVPTSASYRYEQSVNVTFTGVGSREGYTFGGWSDGTNNYKSNGTTSFTMPDDDVILTARWTVVHYTLILNRNGGSWTSGYSEPVSYTIEGGVTLPVAANIEKEGYTFEGWYDNSTCTGDPVTVVPAGFTLNLNYYAKWTPIEYTITYELDGGTNNASNPETYTVEDEITLAAPTKEGDYGFGGWYTNDSFTAAGRITQIDSGSTGNKTLYAKWLPLYATVGGPQYFTKEATVTAITEATGDISVVLYSPVTASDLGSAQSEGKICYAIKNSQADTISLSVANGHSISLESCMNMFNGCTKLVSADLRGFNTSNVTNMGYMFAACTSLSTLNISTFDFSKVSYIVAMFRGCTALTSLDGVNFACKPSSTTEMFKGCSALSALDISALDTSIATSMDSMFEDCSSLTELDVSGFNTEKVKNMQSLFRGCKKLTSLNLSNFNTADVTKMGFMFYQCEKLTDLNLASFDTSKVADMTYMFCSCKEVTSITVSSNFVTDAVTSSSEMFMNCSKLIGGAGTPYSSEHIDVTYARIDGGTSNPGYFTGIIGAKAKPDAVGDIVFKDGSATAYTSGMTLSNNQKSAAIAVIFYKGSSSDSLGAKTLGIGLKKSESTLAWAASDTTGSTTNFTEIQCTDSNTEPASGTPYCTYVANSFGTDTTFYVTGDFDGSDNWSKIQSLDSAGSSSANAPTNYPAWDWVNNYASVSGSHVAGTIFATGWYIPTVGESCKFADDIVTVNAALTAAGGDENCTAWTSSQYAKDTDANADEKAYIFGIAGVNSYKYPTPLAKTSTYTVRAIHRF